MVKSKDMSTSRRVVLLENTNKKVLLEEVNKLLEDPNWEFKDLDTAHGWFIATMYYSGQEPSSKGNS
jgi:hypothetical protein